MLSPHLLDSPSPPEMSLACQGVVNLHSRSCPVFAGTILAPTLSHYRRRALQPPQVLLTMTSHRSRRHRSIATGIRVMRERHRHSKIPQQAHRADHPIVPRLTRREFILGGTVLYLCGCATAPITGRSQLMLVSESEEHALGVQAYREVLRKEPITHDPEATEPLRRIVARLATVADRPDYQWEVNAIKDDQTVNAFVLPGGKIGVYTGIFPIAQTEAGMAIILGHEAGHAIARHAAERISHQLGAQVVSNLLSAGFEGSPYAEMVMAAFGLGAQVGVLLPYSRLQESEADRIGLVLAARAGYDPRAAPGVWQRMAALPGGRPPEFLSTHPEPEARIKDIEEFLPQAMAEFRPHTGSGDASLPAPQEISGPR
jgi:Zn-dependent protease with chaperone function